MKRRFAGGRRRKHAKRIIRLALFLLILCALIVYLDSRIRPVVKGMAESAASIVSANVVNKAVYDCLALEDERGEEIILLEKDSSGGIVAIHSNIAKINRLKAVITTAAQEEMMKHTDGAVTIPLGNITGIDFLSGRGPDITIKYKMSSSVQTAVTSDLPSAAINQSRHRIMLDVTTNVYIIMPAFNTSTSSTTSYCIAETVIVGDAPDSYAEMTDDLMNGPDILG